MRKPGIEPGTSVWETNILPLNYLRLIKVICYIYKFHALTGNRTRTVRLEGENHSLQTINANFTNETCYIQEYDSKLTLQNDHMRLIVNKKVINDECGVPFRRDLLLARLELAKLQDISLTGITIFLQELFVYFELIIVM